MIFLNLRTSPSAITPCCGTGNWWWSGLEISKTKKNARVPKQNSRSDDYDPFWPPNWCLKPWLMMVGITLASERISSKNSVGVVFWCFTLNFNQCFGHWEMKKLIWNPHKNTNIYFRHIGDHLKQHFGMNIWYFHRSFRQKQPEYHQNDQPNQTNFNFN